MKKRITFGVISIVLIVTSMSVIIPTRGNATPKEVPSEALLSDFNINNGIMNIKELNDPESYTQVVHTQLKEISGINNVSISPLMSIKATQSTILYDAVDYWLLNFTYNKLYQSQSHQEDTSGIIQYDLNQTITTTVFASMPVILVTYRNNSMNTNARTQIITQAYVDSDYPARMGFSINFDIEYFFKAQILGIGPIIGPGEGSIPFERSWAFNTPLDGQTVLGKVGASFPSIIPLLNIGVSVGPKIDSDFSASVSSSASGVALSTDFLTWEKDGAIQAFSMEVPEFYFQDYVTTDLFDFDMEFILSLVFYLDIAIGLPIFNLPFHFPIFSFPISTSHLLTENVDFLTLTTNVLPSDDLPFVYGVAYNSSDVNGNNNGILEPGDTVDFSVVATNLGDGSALQINTSADSVNVSVSGEDYIPLLLKNQENFELQTGFQFTIPSAYSGNFILVNVTFEYFSVNGSTWSNIYELYFKVVHPGDTYLEVTDLILAYPGDYWKSGDSLGICFNVTNRGVADIENAQILVANALDTDTINPASLLSDQTNSSSVTIDSSEILGFINVSTMASHDDGLIYLYFYIYYEDATFAYIDLLYFAVPIFSPKPSFSLIYAIGYDSDSDGLFEAGEALEVEFSIQNIGDGAAYTVSGFITSDNPDLNITKSHIVFADLPMSGIGTSTLAEIQIPLTARNQTATFTLHLLCTDSHGNLVYQTCNITMDIVELPPPEITLLSYSIDDSQYGNGDGIPDPGEIFLLYINIQVNNVGFRVAGSASTSSDLVFYNASSSYGDLNNQIANGDGFIVEIPLNYPGGSSRIDINVFAESYAGRKITASGYLELSIETGDISAPSMTLVGTIPSYVFQNSTLSFSINIQDTSVVNEIMSGLDKVLLIWLFNDGEIQISTIQDPDLNGIFDFELDSSTLGVYYFIPVAIDVAGNIQILMKNGEVFIIEIIADTTTSTTISLSSTTTTTITTTIAGTPISFTFILLSLVIVSSIARIYQRAGKRK